MAIDWIESGFIATTAWWQWTQPIYSDWIRVRHSVTTEYQSVLDEINEKRFKRGWSGITLWGKICQGTDRPLQSFQEQTIYQNTAKSELIYFPRPPLLLPNERKIGVLGQRYYKFTSPSAQWIVHIDTPVIPINATLPDFVNPSTPLSASQVQQIASELLLQMKADSRAEPVPINLL